MVNFEENYHFSRFQRGFNIFQGVQLFPGGGGGVQLLIPYRNPYTCDFPGGGGSGPPAPPPSGSALEFGTFNVSFDIVDPYLQP